MTIGISFANWLMMSLSRTSADTRLRCTLISVSGSIPSLVMAAQLMTSGMFVAADHHSIAIFAEVSSIRTGPTYCRIWGVIGVERPACPAGIPRLAMLGLEFCGSNIWTSGQFPRSEACAQAETDIPSPHTAAVTNLAVEFMGPALRASLRGVGGQPCPSPLFSLGRCRGLIKLSRQAAGAPVARGWRSPAAKISRDSPGSLCGAEGG